MIDQVNFENKKEFFQQGTTRQYSFRIEQLKKLKNALKKYETEALDALHQDFHKPAFEAYTSEVGFLYHEINHTLKNLKHWIKPRQVHTPPVLFRSRSRIHVSPYGVVLIISPWNYPLQLALSPLVGAIAAGNCAVIKPSHETPHTAKLIEKIISHIYPDHYISVVQGAGSKVVPHLMDTYRFDHIFFTGSVPIGRKIGEAAASKHIPFTLELGGKSPVIVDKNCHPDIAAKRIIWGKFLNAGQTCVSPDYLLIDQTIKKVFLEKMVYHLKQFYGDPPQDLPDFTHIVNERRFKTLKNYLKEGRIIYGGQTVPEKNFIAPTLIDEVKLDSPIMKEEIFGPILPVITYQNQTEIMKIIQANPFPLALYLFTNNKQFEEQIIDSILFGGGCINNTLVHLTNPELPFGGVGFSGRGNYHGKYSFDTFSHEKAIVKTGNWPDFAMKYPPYTEKKFKLIRYFLK